MPAVDPFGKVATGLGHPATGMITITPSDTEDLPVIPRVLMVRQEGDVNVIMRDGSSGILPALQPGVPYPFRVRRVMSNGTDAEGIVGLF